MAKKKLSDLHPGCSSWDIETVIKHEGGFIDVGSGSDHHKVRDKDGHFITPIPVRKDLCIKTFKNIIRLLMAAGFFILIGFIYLWLTNPTAMQTVLITTRNIQ